MCFSANEKWFYYFLLDFELAISKKIKRVLGIIENIAINLYLFLAMDLAQRIGIGLGFSVVITMLSVFCGCTRSDSVPQEVPIDALQQIVLSADSIIESAPDSAIAIYEDVIERSELNTQSNLLADSITANLYRARAFANRGIAVVYGNTGKLNDALDYISKAFADIEVYKDILPDLYLSDWIVFANSKGVFQKKIGNYPDALKTYQDAVSIALQHNDSNSIAIFYTNTANIYQEIGEPNKALEYTNKALQLHKLLGNTRGVAISSLTLANILNSTERYAEAKPYYEEVLAFCVARGLYGNVEYTCI